jgi:tetratricopeptide (TPR) repeat protein
MKRGGFTFVACSSLAIAACSAPNVQVRALPDPAAKLRQGGDELANARSMLALGNVGLALEGFRTVEIMQPTNPDVYVGIAECYAAMSRYDVARSNYETALAYAPHDPALLAALARSLDHLGETERAAAVREELVHLASPAAQPKPQLAALAPAGPWQLRPVPLAPQVGSITVKLPPARPLASAAPGQSLQSMVEPVKIAEPAKPEPALAPMPVAIAKAEPPRIAAPKPVTVENEARAIRLQPSTAEVPVELGSATFRTLEASTLKMPVPAIAKAEAAPPKTTAAVEVAVPGKPEPPRAPVPAAVTLVGRPNDPYSGFRNASALVAQLIAMEPAIKPRDPDPRAPEQEIANGPRLERVSLGEVALVTTPAPLWKKQMASIAPRRAAVQWLPIRSAEARPAIQLLNAARTQGLAAWSRMTLANRGWRRIDIGDYGEVRQRSLVMYSGDHAPLARRLAAQFGCKAIKVDGKPAVIVLLGRDAASKKASSLRA